MSWLKLRLLLGICYYYPREYIVVLRGSWLQKFAERTPQKWISIEACRVGHTTDRFVKIELTRTAYRK